MKLQERVQRVDTFVRGTNKAPAAEKNTGWPKNAQKHVFLGLTKKENTKKHFPHLGSRCHVIKIRCFRFVSVELPIHMYVPVGWLLGGSLSLVFP